MNPTIKYNTDAYSFQPSLSKLEPPNYNFSDAQYPLSPDVMLDIIISQRIPPDILKKIERRIHTPLRDLIRPGQRKSRHRTGPPRPQNMYILYRRDLQKKINEVKGHDVGSQLEFVSKIASRGWEKIDSETRLLYNYIAECAKEFHSYIFPGYTYQPKKKAIIAESVYIFSTNELTDDALCPSTLSETQPNVSNITSTNYTVAHNNIVTGSIDNSYPLSPSITSLSSPVLNNTAFIDNSNSSNICNWAADSWQLSAFSCNSFIQDKPLIAYDATTIDPSWRNLLPPLSQPSTSRSHVDRGHLHSVDRQVRL
ncbi:9605_t:CDS:1 [Paraglomus brasilianum]|uniref:9605_t:CDS:1 n=1 Tax=Paraglomus brasilianum TaxID=144538 RepID=A0A9N8VGN7_9GLOM|nr:9605_t:CDS:1 [Paraglomus brasilianum]